MITKLFLGAVFVFTASVFFVGVVEALWLAWLYLGIAFLVLGILLMSDDHFREKYYRSSLKDSEWERVHSEKDKKLFDKYYFPFRGILGGIAAIALYYIAHQQLFVAISTWFIRVF